VGFGDMSLFCKLLGHNEEQFAREGPYEDGHAYDYYECQRWFCGKRWIVSIGNVNE